MTPLGFWESYRFYRAEGTSRWRCVLLAILNYF
jgi:hypothetical protein